MDSIYGGLRRQSLQKLAILAATAPPSIIQTDLDRLCQGCSHDVYSESISVEPNSTPKPVSDAHKPMTVREFEVLIALCKASPILNEKYLGEKLARQLSPYLLEVHVQELESSPFFRNIEPSPVEVLTSHLTTALLSLGINHGSLQETVENKIWAYLDRCQLISSDLVSRSKSHNDIKDAIEVATVTVSIIGFLDAAATHANFWGYEDRLCLIERVKLVLSQAFLVVVEKALSTIYNSQTPSLQLREWKRYIRMYASTGRPLGAMLLQRSFVWLLVATTSLLSVEVDVLAGKDILDLRLSDSSLFKSTFQIGSTESEAIETLANIASDQITLLEDEADYLRLGSVWQQRLAYSTKAGALISYLNCILYDENAADVGNLMAWLEISLADPVQMADKTLASVVLRSLALISRSFTAFAPSVSRVLPRFIIQGSTSSQSIAVASSCLAIVLQLLSHDAIISTIYTLGNVLSSGWTTDRTLSANLNAELGLDGNGNNFPYEEKHPSISSIVLAANTEEETLMIYGNIVKAICSIATACNDSKITALAQSMLLQKIDKVNKSIDARIITEASGLALSGGPLEFRSLLKLYAKMTTEGITQKNDALLLAILKGRNYLSTSLHRDSALFDIYLRHLLEAIISKGDLHQVESTREADVEFAAQEIEQLLNPLAILMSNSDLASLEDLDEDIFSLIRDSWFNIVVHGFAMNTERGTKYLKELRLMAMHSKPLVAEQRGEQVESDIELNTVLRRGGSSEYESRQKRRLSCLLTSRVTEIRGLSYSKVIFLHAAYLVEILRAGTGDCTKALTYFLEPSMRKGDMSITMESITSAVMDVYLNMTLTGTNSLFLAPCVSKQLASIFGDCCHRIDRVQQAAVNCADRIMRDVPSALCHRYSLFALLDLLSLMWISCLEAETDEYECKSSFTSSRSNITIELSDDFKLRRQTLDNLYKRAKTWVTSVINIAPLDVKGLLQTYLSEYDNDEVYDQISLGRSFAIEMGSFIPSTDQKLVAIDRVGDCNINTASEFVAQYTTRQEYRYSNVLPNHDASWLKSAGFGHRRKLTLKDLDFENAITVLSRLEIQIHEQESISLAEIRDILRRAATLIYRNCGEGCAIVHYLVSIPFSLFTEESIKLGISLWLGVMNENPQIESRFLTEISQNWEMSIHKRYGAFNSSFIHIDPFCDKVEFAPSDRTLLSRKAKIAQSLLAPHVRLMQFLGSHFNATRLGSPHTERVFLRILDVTLDGLKHATAHPLAREARFQIILFGLKVLRHCIGLDRNAKCDLKNKILSAALLWFSFAPCWSFGGNRLQLKAESRLLTDVAVALRTVELKSDAAPVSFIKLIQSKEALLHALIESEKLRIGVWLHPLNYTQIGQTLNHATKGVLEANLLGLVKTAWAESPALAIQLATRFPSIKIHKEVRWLLLNYPERAISDPNAVHILLGTTFPDDVSSQLKYLLYWAPVNPITAITYFLPAYRNDPYIIQYAMRALESHPIDVTFFYVPQIVQILRYDTLGYIEKYIVETAQLSQLFSHQIIWNMKANAFKDEESQIPDPLKPTLDKVMNRMISEFSIIDKSFYEKEFAFFDKVTSISGKLKPFIKRPKPEKKQKIEEELRKIQVEVGVYLPSNPDGVVIGIDRKSGKPLQSHAKAPFMATFRIRKTLVNNEETAGILDNLQAESKPAHENTIEIWQSAIFKVGDDCRQDVLALQMIAAFRGIFNNVGLDVYVFPYRVTATAPGCGVIDVLPNSISRDMLGREAVNGLYDYFVSKYGNEDSLRFQEARSNFIKSMAAYSIISFLLQFKDRHNGNIMIDDAGHILHIDFGFCFDIAPGGVKFERAPFKLTSEMLAVMGGNTEHQAFKWFEELCVKAFLASRQHAEKLSQLVLVMLGSGLPCFKPETIKNFRDRFVLEKTEREAAEFMKGLIKTSYKSYSTGVYDQFQLLTNGIPY